MRWGVTGEQADQAASLLLCLRELERADVVIGLFGERYGAFVAHEGGALAGGDEAAVRMGRAIDEAQRSYGWVAQYRDRSATELEVRLALHALDGKPHKPQFYYLREGL